MEHFEIRDNFYGDGKPIKIISGAFHYFRTVPEYWRDRLEKLKAMGCNTVETYIPWNMHEPDRSLTSAATNVLSGPQQSRVLTGTAKHTAGRWMQR